MPVCIVSPARTLQEPGLHLGYTWYVSYVFHTRVLAGSFGVAAVTLKRLDVLAYYFCWLTTAFWRVEVVRFSTLVLCTLLACWSLSVSSFGWLVPGIYLTADVVGLLNWLACLKMRAICRRSPLQGGGCYFPVEVGGVLFTG